MKMNDRDALQYASRIILIFVPFFSSFFDTWSWIVEILLLFAVFIHGRGTGLRLTVYLLAASYLSAIIQAGSTGLLQIGFTPWAGILFLALEQRGLTTAHNMFWGLMLASLLSALPVIPAMQAALQPENLHQTITSTLQLFYDQEGFLTALENQGLTTDQFEKSLRIVITVMFKLKPSIAGIAGMLELGLVYLFYQLSQKKRLANLALWRLPWYGVWVAIIGLAAYLTADYLKSGTLEIIGLNIMVIIAAIALVLGFSCQVYYLKNPKIPRSLKWLVFFMWIFAPYFVLLGLVLTGLFDLVKNFRRIPEKIEEAKQ